MVESQTNDENWRNGVLLTYTIIAALVCLALIITSFIWFTGDADANCGHNTAIIIVTIVMFFIVFVLRCRKYNSLLTAALANVWICYMGWSALAS